MSIAWYKTTTQTQRKITWKKVFQAYMLHQLKIHWASLLHLDLTMTSFKTKKYFQLNMSRYFNSLCCKNFHQDNSSHWWLCKYFFNFYHTYIYIFSVTLQKVGIKKCIIQTLYCFEKSVNLDIEAMTILSPTFIYQFMFCKAWKQVCFS